MERIIDLNERLEGSIDLDSDHGDNLHYESTEVEVGDSTEPQEEGLAEPKVGGSTEPVIEGSAEAERVRSVEANFGPTGSYEVD
ncbi:hypothetical protein Sjap_021296 [Stephania japonica]|uniref:Uncharacterized protein n=1 Tax=Stephania japonica TaxID=461633 RepID=A0AAP0EVK6_9MAGN